jgi:transcriptional regulator with XRE-family HTH domain
MVTRIKTERVQKGLSQEALAEHLDVSRGSISLWEAGRDGGSMETINRMCDLFGCTADWLLGRSETRSLRG